MTSEATLLDEVFLPDGRSHGGRPRSAPPVEIEIVRALTDDDIPALASRVPIGYKPQGLSAIRHAHHQIAQLVAQGRPLVEVALITGYRPEYLTRLVNSDPAFQELLGYYASQREAIFVDVLERMKQLGLTSLEELQERLAERPEEFSHREIMEMTELMLIKPMTAARGAPQAQAAPGVTVNLKFVQARQGPVIDGEAREAREASPIIEDRELE